MARTYRGVIEEHIKGRAPEQVTYETQAKSEANASKAIIGAALDMSPAGTKVGLLGISRLNKKGQPVNGNLDKCKPTSTIVLLGKWADVKDTSEGKEVQEVKIHEVLKDEVIAAPPGKPWLSGMMDDVTATLIAEGAEVVYYDKDNRLISI